MPAGFVPIEVGEMTETNDPLVKLCALDFDAYALAPHATPMFKDLVKTCRSTPIPQQEQEKEKIKNIQKEKPKKTAKKTKTRERGKGKKVQHLTISFFFSFFFCRRAARARSGSERSVHLSELAALPTLLQPTGFVFHEARVGSTLVANMLASDPRNLVYASALLAT